MVERSLKSMGGGKHRERYDQRGMDGRGTLERNYADPESLFGWWVSE